MTNAEQKQEKQVTGICLYRTECPCKQMGEEIIGTKGRRSPNKCTSDKPCQWCISNGVLDYLKMR